MRVLTVFNHSGGAGKTSVTRDVGYTLAHLGYRVLLIDLDPQASLSSWLGIAEAPSERTVQATLVQEAELPEPYETFGMHLIPSNLALAMVEAQLPGVMGGVLLLREAVRKLQGYDFVLIDSPPSLGQLSASGAIAADAMIVPVPTTHKGVSGIPHVHQMISTYRRLNPGLHVAYYLPTQYNASTLHHRESLEGLRAALKPLGSPITYRPAVYPDAHAAGQPVGAYQPGSPADREIRKATQELLGALGVSDVRS